MLKLASRWFGDLARRGCPALAQLLSVDAETAVKARAFEGGAGVPNRRWPLWSTAAAAGIISTGFSTGILSCDAKAIDMHLRTSLMREVPDGRTAPALNPVPVHDHALKLACQPQQPAKGPSSLTEQLVRALWADVTDDIQRADAELPEGVTVTELHSPEVVCSSSDPAVVVRIPVREGVDLKRMEQALLDHRLATSSGSQGGGEAGRPSRSFFSSSISWRSSPEARTMVISHREAGREIRFTIPSAYSRQLPCVEVQKQGALEQEDLTLCAQIMARANRLEPASAAQQGGNGWREGPFGHGPRGLFGEGWRERDPFGGLPFGGPFGGLEGFARQMEEFQELANAMEELVQDQGSKGVFTLVGETQLDSSHRARRSGGTPGVEGLQTTLAQGQMRESGPGGTLRRGGAVDAGTTAGEVSAEEKARATLEGQARELEALGARVYLPEANEGMDWALMAGYDEQKALIEDIILISLRNPEVFSGLAARTRRDKKAQRPKAVLFDGPPGTGKTTSARIIAKQAAIPLVYIPLESVSSKWYGESEQKLSQMLGASEAMGGCIIFLDEVDSLATSRGDGMYEATRRLLGVLLRFIDGFEATSSIVVAATNRKQDLDAALLSRFDSIITFGLPDASTRASILKHYAAHMADADLDYVAEATPGMSARDLRAICEVTERRWAAAIVKGQQPKESLPPVEAYLLAARARQLSMGGESLKDHSALLAGLGKQLASEMRP